MADPERRRTFLIQSLSTAVTAAFGTSLAGCGNDDGAAQPLARSSEFTYGVASGDPLPDRVILWTYARYPVGSDPVHLTWQVATDSGFTAVVAQGNIDASESTGFTAKVDATGLSAGTTYFYRFMDPTGHASIAGTTRTLPALDVASVKFAVLSCALYPAGYFNAYDSVAKSDALYAIHLGDYIHEHGVGDADAVARARAHVPAEDPVKLGDYRVRYALYRSDPSLQALHAKMPWITVWDDREFANHANPTGAQNHDSATQGDWTARKAAAAQAYHEWLPIRAPDPTDLLRIYRRFDFGRLLSLHMLDTRLEGRVQQFGNFGDASDPSYKYADYDQSVFSIVHNGSIDARRTMISATQQAWLINGLAASSAAWQIVGSQTLMSRIWFPRSVLDPQRVVENSPTPANQQTWQAAITAFIAAKTAPPTNVPSPLALEQFYLLNRDYNKRLPYNLDSWDGYRSNRDKLLDAIKGLGRKLVVVSGDSGNAWFGNVTSNSTEIVGVEFGGPSVNTPGFDGVNLGSLAPSIDGTVLGPSALGAHLGVVDDAIYSNTSQRGYLLMTVTATSVKGDYVYLSTVKSTDYTAAVGRSITVTTSGAVTSA